jgi:DegV family protein with EDD domain
MKDYVIMTDSCSDLPREYVEKNKIPFVSLTCTFEDKEYADDFGKSLNYKDFYQGMAGGVIPKTSQPSPEAFYKTFSEILSTGRDIIYICVSSGLSGTYNSASIARNMVIEEFEEANIAILDVLTASLGQGIMVMKAVDMKTKGASFDEVVNYVDGIKLNLNTYITVDDLNHLKRGGRISTAAAFVGTILHVKPLLTLNNEGKVMAILKVKGRKSALNKLASFVINKIEAPEDEIVTICHGDVVEEAERLRDIILKEKKVKEVIINHIGPVVGTYGGPGALAVFFIGKHRQNHMIDVDI